MKTPSNASIRRAITTLKKASMIEEDEVEIIRRIEQCIEAKTPLVSLSILTPWHLLTPKKTRRKALKYKQVKVSASAADGDL